MNIRPEMEDNHRGANVPSRSERRRLALEQLQQSGGGGDCVEVTDGFPGVVPVRDSKAPHGPALLLSAVCWASFIGELKAGHRH